MCGRKIDVTSEAKHFGAYDSDLVEAHQVGSVLGLACFTCERFSPMMLLLPHEKAQLLFWQQLLGRELLDDEAVLLRMKQREALVDMVPLQQHTLRHFRGLVVHMEAGQAERLLREGLRAEVPRWVQDCPSIAVRMPMQFATHCLHGTWPSVLLPHLRVEARQGTSALNVDWGLLGLRFQDLPCAIQRPLHPLPDGACLDQNAVALSSVALHQSSCASSRVCLLART